MRRKPTLAQQTNEEEEESSKPGSWCIEMKWTTTGLESAEETIFIANTFSGWGANETCTLRCVLFRVPTLLGFATSPPAASSSSSVNLITNCNTRHPPVCPGEPRGQSGGGVVNSIKENTFIWFMQHPQGTNFKWLSKLWWRMTIIINWLLWLELCDRWWWWWWCWCLNDFNSQPQRVTLTTIFFLVLSEWIYHKNSITRYGGAQMSPLANPRASKNYDQTIHKHL